ncbi:hypothetical protein DPMN_117855 [Dreissena polymorpha]|uniref:Uncharacterized protein n=1 Tax=Dreissena polymorpha TaxID=45954 RepID=A0A9D4GFU1_DREPO|nr:hypothetical protein DPMN_117855 [Dreissena polymorpha]
MNNKWPHGGNVFQQTGTIFELSQYIIGKNLLTKFHEDPTINVASTVLTRQIFMTHNGRQTNDKRLFTCFHYIHIEKTSPPPGGHVFPPIWTIFELNRHIQKTHVLTKLHEDWTKNVTSRVFTCFHYIHIEKTAPPPGGHIFAPIWTIFKLVRDINETNVLTKNTAPPPGGHLHKDWASNVTSTVFTSFKLSRGINGTNVLTKFHEDQTINVASGYTYMYPRLYPNWSGLPEQTIYLRLTMNNRAILEGATSLTPPSIALSSIQFSTGKCLSH